MQNWNFWNNRAAKEKERDKIEYISKLRKSRNLVIMRKYREMISLYHDFSSLPFEMGIFEWNGEGNFEGLKFSIYSQSWKVSMDPYRRNLIK